VAMDSERHGVTDTEFLIVDSFSIFADFSGVREFTLSTAHALYVPLTRKMREIWKLGMNLLLGTVRSIRQRT
jgi:hypothetical protein